MQYHRKAEKERRVKVITLRVRKDQLESWQKWLTDNASGYDRVANVIRRAVDLYIQSEQAHKDLRDLWKY